MGSTKQEAFRVVGGKPLHGTVRISGTKNLISKLMVASTLSDQKSHFTNATVHLGEVEITEDILSSMGAMLDLSDDNNGSLNIQTDFNTSLVPERFAGLNRTKSSTSG